VRYPLAALISSTRAKASRANYAIMGGASPLLPETRAQQNALQAALSAREPDVETAVFIAMRYWRPRAAETAADVAAFAPDEIVLLPLYPQFSTTTTASSVADFRRVYRGPGVLKEICCYPEVDGVADAHADAIREVWEAAGRPEGVRLLFSAHGLPQRVVDAGDPYQAQVEATARAVAVRVAELADWRVCYQSRVGRLKWLEPSTEDEIRRAGAEDKSVLLAPIAFVSEHVETLVELDHEYRELATEAGVPVFLRSRTPGVRTSFIATLADAVQTAGTGPKSHGGWSCPAACEKCPSRERDAA